MDHSVNTYINNTSLRCRPLKDTLRIAKEYTGRCGITRVTDVTQLDYIGLPVYVSIRPEAADGTICVTAGKGIRREEAQAGAYMEAIEYTLAEPGRSELKIHKGQTVDVLDGREREEAILDLCPKLGRKFDLEEAMDLVTATDLATGREYFVPAECAFFPYRPTKSYFGNDTNGLSSGNSLAEASIHGILELIERDIMSFQTISQQTGMVRVEADSCPEHARKIMKMVEDAGLELIIKYGENHFGIPYFHAVIIDKQTENPIYINGGYGCHTNKVIALNRAVAEAVQSRLGFIHGGRDDLVETYQKYEEMDPVKRRNLFQQLAAFHRRSKKNIAFTEIGEFDWTFDTLEDYLNQLIAFLDQHGMSSILRVSFTQPEEPLQVVKMIVPKLEFFNQESLRMGQRLKSYATKIAHHTIRRSQPV